MTRRYFCVKYHRKLHFRRKYGNKTGKPPDSGYIFFKRKSNPAFAHTQGVVIVAGNGMEEFIFTDNTLIVEANNPTIRVPSRT
jgi:hypothetical protein